MFGFFIFNAIRSMTSELTAAKVARFVSSMVPRNRFTYYVTDVAWLWVNEKTKFHSCEDCYTEVIERDYPNVCKDCQDIRDSDIAQEQAAYNAILEEIDAENAAYNAMLKEEEKEYDRQIEELYADYDEQDEPCPGHCDQSIRNCTCAEIDSFAKHNADPATRGSWWTP